jgi:hypothetical protein
VVSYLQGTNPWTNCRCVAVVKPVGKHEHGLASAAAESGVFELEWTKG